MSVGSGEFSDQIVAATADDRSKPLSSVTSTERRKLEFLPRLESARGLAAVAVVWYHVTGQFIDTSVTGLGPVVLFFVLSGFVLARSLHNDPSPIDFFRHRVFRLLPAAAAVVLLLTFLHYRYGFYVGYLAPFDPLNVLLNALMIRNDINGVMWSMTVECFATPLIFWSDWMCRRGQITPVVTLTVVLLALSSVGPYAHLLGGFTNLAPLYAFPVGVLLHHRGRALTDKLTPFTGVGLACAALALFAFCGLKKQSALIILLECASSGVLLTLIALQPAIAMFRVLDAKIVRFYGRISYSLYLLHPIGISIALRNLDTSSLPALAAILATGAVAIAATTAMAFLSWRLIEKPFVALGKRFDRRKTGAAMSPPLQPEQARP